MKFTLKQIINYCSMINKRVEKGEDVNDIADLIIKFENDYFLAMSVVFDFGVIRWFGPN